MGEFRAGPGSTAKKGISSSLAKPKKNKNCFFGSIYQCTSLESQLENVFSDIKSIQRKFDENNRGYLE